MSTLLKLGLSDYGVNPRFCASNVNISYKIHFFFGEKNLVALDTYAKKMNPSSIVFFWGGGARYGLLAHSPLRCLWAEVCRWITSLARGSSCRGTVGWLDEAPSIQHSLRIKWHKNGAQPASASFNHSCPSPPVGP